MRFSHIPSTKYLALFKASATASPSLGAYLDSAGWVNLLPTSVIFQPDVQESESCPGHVQCFRNSQNPMPVFDQSLAKQVGLLRSNILTPCSIYLMMAFLEI